MEWTMLDEMQLKDAEKDWIHYSHQPIACCSIHHLTPFAPWLG